MHPPVVTKDPTAVEKAVKEAWLAMFPDRDPALIHRAFGWAAACFRGMYQDYQAVDAPYHDFEHTLQGTLCLARLLHGRHRTGVEPVLTPKFFELGLLAILLHDTGYLKRRDDTEGTGAKYTVTHVDRSAVFAGTFLAEKGFAPEEVRAVQHMIHCTGLNVVLDAISFQCETERVVGYALGTADLLGQMAAPDYVDKLPALYAEFAEAIRFSRCTNHFVARYSSAADLMKKTPGFWDQAIQIKLARDFGGLYRFLNDPYPNGSNDYLDRIEANMERLRRRMAVSAT